MKAIRNFIIGLIKKILIQIISKITQNSKIKLKLVSLVPVRILFLIRNFITSEFKDSNVVSVKVNSDTAKCHEVRRLIQIYYEY